MRIGIPKETKIGETRVALTPEAANALVRAGHQVLVQTQAGHKASFSDEDYQSLGCSVVGSAQEIWETSDMVVKVKEPQKEEYQYLKDSLLLVSYLHLAGEPELTEAMKSSKIVSFAYELYQDNHGRLPLLKPMSQIAGRLSVVVGSHLLLSSEGGRGTLLGGACGVKRGKVTIVGGGVAGRAACEMAVGQGAQVTILERSPMVMEALELQFGNRIQILQSNPTCLQRELEDTDLLIGAVLIPGARAPHVITRSHIASMREGSVFVDISIDQGGCSETSRATLLSDPTYVESGVVHYGVCNIPALVPRTSAQALSDAILPFIQDIAKGKGNWHPHTFQAMCTRDGLVVHQAVDQATKTDLKRG